MDLTLSDNGIIDQTDLYYELEVPVEQQYVPAIHIHFNDDLTTKWLYQNHISKYYIITFYPNDIFWLLRLINSYDKILFFQIIHYFYLLQILWIAKKGYQMLLIKVWIPIGKPIVKSLCRRMSPSIPNMF